MLKTDLHTHAGAHEKGKGLDYSPKQLINYMSKHGYEVISITNHNMLTYSKKLRNYAKSKGVLLVPGVERTIEGKDVLLLNINKELINKINTFADLEKYKEEGILVIAPHPFYPDPKSLHSKLIKNINLFDAIEFSHFYIRWWTFNKKAEKTAKKYNLPLIGTSDCHMFGQVGSTYTLIDSEKNTESLFEAIRKKKSKIVTKPLPLLKAIKILFKVYVRY
ncbi:MAG: PHP domain-containing protein [Candidatus Woesearchaeota archaeon]|nr:PHP domain-containing protein [Candidatus Woesearchaeota archaeon]